jgi:hypothetical protein
MCCFFDGIRVRALPVFAFSALSATHVYANPDLTPVWEGLRSSFAVDFWQLLEPPSAPFPASLWEGFNASMGLDLPFAKGRDNRGALQRVQGSLRYNPMTYWYTHLDAFYYLREQAAWEPDFVYHFGYDDWHPYTLSLVYENQSPNRFRPNRAEGEQRTYFNQGVYSLGWKFLLWDTLAQPMLFDINREISCQISYHFAPRYQTMSGQVQTHKQSASLNCHYPIYDKWGLSLKFFHYPDPSQQQAWDPDYSYEIGYADWEPGSFSVLYKNSSGNRYPWNDSLGDGGWRKGSLHFSWNWPW